MLKILSRKLSMNSKFSFLVLHQVFSFFNFRFTHERNSFFFACFWKMGRAQRERRLDFSKNQKNQHPNFVFSSRMDESLEDIRFSLQQLRTRNKSGGGGTLLDRQASRDGFMIQSEKVNGSDDESLIALLRRQIVDLEDKYALAELKILQASRKVEAEASMISERLALGSQKLVRRLEVETNSLKEQVNNLFWKSCEI